MAWIIGTLPDGQLNPNPDAGLHPIYFGAYSLCRMSKRLSSIGGQFAGLQNLWHPLGNGDGNVPNRTKIQVQDAILLMDDTIPLRKILQGHSAQ